MYVCVNEMSRPTYLGAVSKVVVVASSTPDHKVMQKKSNLVWETAEVGGTPLWGRMMVTERMAGKMPSRLENAPHPRPAATPYQHTRAPDQRCRSVAVT